MTVLSNVICFRIHRLPPMYWMVDSVTFYCFLYMFFKLCILFEFYCLHCMFRINVKL